MTIMRYDSYGDSFEEDPGNGRFVELEDVQKAISKVAQEQLVPSSSGEDSYDYMIALRARTELLCAIAKELDIAIFTAIQKKRVEIELEDRAMLFEELVQAPVIIDEVITIKKD